MELLGIDFGRRFVGLARASHPPGIATPWRTLAVRGREDAIRQLIEIIRSEEFDRLVMGLPIHESGEEGAAVRRLRRIGRAISSATGVDVAFVDEYATTAEARDRSGSDEERVDAAAAAIILERYLETGWEREP